MEMTGCEEQVAAVAASVKGDPTAAPFAGELMAMPPVEGAAVVDPESGAEEPEFVEPGAEGDELGDVAA